MDHGELFGEGATFKRNPNYWDKTRQPTFERMEVHVLYIWSIERDKAQLLCRPT